MQRTVLLLGSNGQLGTELRWEFARAQRDWNVIATSRATLDISDRNAVKAAVRAASPDFVINATAYTAVDAAETDRDLAFRVNAEAVESIAEAAAHCGAFVVHFSTDYVFDGRARQPYIEPAHACPVNVYGESKLEGERCLQRSGARHLIIRSGWLYSTHNFNFVLSILNKAKAGQDLRVVNDQIGTPTPAGLLAKETCRALATVSNAESKDAFCGVFHVAAKGEASWFDFAKAVLGSSELGAGSDIPAVSVIPVSSEQLGAPAKRPPYSVLDTNKFYSTFGGRPVPWQQAFADTFGSKEAIAANGPR